MSLLKAIKAQLGLSNTPANNFTITAEADNGTLKLARGNAGATTQDILTVDASGNVLVDGNNLNLFSAKSLATNGYQKLPGGVVLQWGLDTLALAPGANRDVTYPVAFPSGVGYVDVSVQSLSVNNQTFVPLVLAPGVGGLTKFNVTNTDVDGSITTFRWFALGW